MSWLQDEKDGSTLTTQAKSRALPFALISRDVYRPGANAIPTSIIRQKSWISILTDPRILAQLSGIDKLEVALGTLLGFNATVYRLTNANDRVAVIAFEGSGSSFGSPDAAKRTVETWLFANASATLDRVNKAGESAIDTVFNTIFGKRPFAGGLNARRSPATAYDLADLLAKAVRHIFGHSTILTGHSLGGGLAQYAAVLNGLRAIGFNSAGTGATRGSANADQFVVRIDTTGMETGSEVINTIVTDYSDFASRHLGTRYLVGKGGHSMDDVIRALQSG